MSLSDAAQEWRAGKLGASEMPAIVLPDGEFWYGAADLYHRKVGNVEVKLSEGPRSPVTAGNLFEAGVLEWAKLQIGNQSGRANVRRAHENGVMGATLDYHSLGSNRTDGQPAIVEIKTTGLFGKPRHFDQWGEDWTDDVPAHVMVQVQSQMACTGLNIAFVGAFIGFRGLAIFQIHRNEELVKLCEQKAIDFWKNHVEAKTSPPNPSWDVMKMLDRAQGPIATNLDRDVIERYKAVGEQLRALEGEQKKLKQRIAASLEVDGELCEVGHDTDAWWRVTFKTTFRKEFTVEASEFRVLRVSQGDAQKAAYADARKHLKGKQ